MSYSPQAASAMELARPELTQSKVVEVKEKEIQMTLVTLVARQHQMILRIKHPFGTRLDD